MILFNYVCDVQRDGVTGFVQTGVSINKTEDRLQYTMNGPMLTAQVLADPPAEGKPVLWKPGDVITMRGASAQSPYTVLSVEDRRGKLIPDTRMIVRGQMVFG